MAGLVWPPDLDGARAVWFGRGQACVPWHRPGAWPPGVVAGLDLGDCPGNRASRNRRPGAPLRRQPALPLMVPGTPEGPRFWWAPCWVELPLPEQQPLDAWFFPALRGTPATWWIPLYADVDALREEVDCDAVAMVWLDHGFPRCPWAPRKFRHTPHAFRDPIRSSACRALPGRYLVYDVVLQEGCLALRGV